MIFRRSTHYLVLAVLFVALFVIAIGVDKPVSRYVAESGLGDYLKSHQAITRSIRFFGNFAEFTLVSVFIILARGTWSKPFRVDASTGRKALYVLVSGATSISASIIKWIVGRHRPSVDHNVFSIHPFSGGWRGLGGPGLSFPSGDVCLAAATAFAIAFLWPRLIWPCIFIIVLVAVERVAEMAHYPSDAVAGAALGWAGACVAYWWIEPPGAIDGGPARGPLNGVSGQQDKGAK